MTALSAPGRAAPIEMIVTAIDAPAANGETNVQITFLNDQANAIEFAAPERVAASIEIGGSVSPVSLVRAGAGPRSISVAAGSFSRAAYHFSLSSLLGGAFVLKLDGGSGGYAYSNTPRSGSADAKVVVVEQTLASPTADKGNSFLGNLSAYQPIYAVYGPGTSTDALIQISFKYQLLGRGGAPAAERRWADGINFAYTQRMYWDLGAKSAPFRNIDFQPELFYLVPAQPLTGAVLIGGQAGVRHESNGRDGAASRSLNTAYIHPTFAFPVGRWSLTLGPQAWAYIGNLSDNPDITRYRGNAGLFAEIGRDDGLRVSTSSRLNFASGRGALNVEVSYPLSRLIGLPVNLYVFGQGFIGYGENLLDYNRHATRLRAGLGFVR